MSALGWSDQIDRIRRRTQMSDEPTAPHCIGCGAVGYPAPHGWVTEHETNCPWAVELVNQEPHQ